MSCNTCANQATAALGAAGVPASGVQAVWAMVWQYLDRCGTCGAWVSPSTGVCNNPRCSMRGQQVAQPRGWPPQGVRFTTNAALVGAPVAMPAPIPVKAPSPPPPPPPAATRATPPPAATAATATRAMPPAVMTPPPAAAMPAPTMAQQQQPWQRPKKPRQLQELNPLPMGTSLALDLGIEQPEQPRSLKLKGVWGYYEYGRDAHGDEKTLPCTGHTYTVGQRFRHLAASGVGAQLGRDPAKATTAGANLPTIADVMAHATTSQIWEAGGMTMWYGEAVDGQPFAAVYDKNTQQSACFVPGCPGIVDGKPCPHQLGAIAAALTEQHPDNPYTMQFLDAVRAHRRTGTLESAVTAGDCAYVLLNELAPEAFEFGSREVAGRAHTTFGGQPGLRKIKKEKDLAVANYLGNPTVPEPSRSERLPAQHDPDFVATPQMQSMLRMTGAGLRLGYSGNNTGMMGRAFGLYGPPGTGKNTIAEETAASLGLPYREIDLGRGADLQALLGEVVLEPDGQGGTRSVTKLGPLGKALVDGEVVALNEIVHTDPDSQTYLHQAIQEGRIQLHNPEGADMVYTVHPASTLFVTWNPRGGEQDRPTEALYSRLFTGRMGYPSVQEETGMLMSWSRGKGLPNFSQADAEKVITFIQDMRVLAAEGGVDVPASFRDAQKFATMWTLTGGPGEAVEQLRGLTSQSEDHELQWSEVTALFGRHFGDEVA